MQRHILSVLALLLSTAVVANQDDVPTINGCKLEPASNCAGMDLRNADLSNMNLRKINFNGANLSGANLRHTQLDLSTFDKANLSGANLTRASLQQASLRGANLNNTKLVAITGWALMAQGAKGKNTDFNGANLDLLMQICKSLNSAKPTWPKPI